MMLHRWFPQQSLLSAGSWESQICVRLFNVRLFSARKRAKNVVISFITTVGFEGCRENLLQLLCLRRSECLCIMTCRGCLLRIQLEKSNSKKKFKLVKKWKKLFCPTKFLLVNENKKFLSILNKILIRMYFSDSIILLILFLS